MKIIFSSILLSVSVSLFAQQLVEKNGNIGIGTSDPIYKLHVINDDVNNRPTYMWGKTYGAAFGVETLSDSYDAFSVLSGINNIGNAGASVKHLFVIKPSGKIGIGTTTPQQQLDVTGFVRSTGTEYFGNGSDVAYLGRGSDITGGWAGSVGSDAFTISTFKDFVIGGWGKSDGAWKGARFIINSDNGNVGIGTTTPTCKLDVYSSSLLKPSPLPAVFRAGGQFGSFFVTTGGEAYSKGVLLTSDSTLKENIKPLTNSLKKLKALGAYTYNFKSDGSSTTSESSKLSAKTKQKSSEDLNHIGLLAQEVQRVLPEAVRYDPNGNLAVSYSDIVALLVESVKELQTTLSSKDSNIDILNQQVSILKKIVKSQEQNIVDQQKQITTIETQIVDIQKNCCKSSTTLTNPKSKASLTSTETPSALDIVLYQNIPNPFTQSTEIKYNLISSVVSASICIFNMQGTLIKNIPITTRGEGKTFISASELSAGMYLYTLIVDGREVDTKRMILTN